MNQSHMPLSLASVSFTFVKYLKMETIPFIFRVVPVSPTFGISSIFLTGLGFVT